MLKAENVSVNLTRTEPSAPTMTCSERLCSASENSMSRTATAAQRQSAPAKARTILTRSPLPSIATAMTASTSPPISQRRRGEATMGWSERASLTAARLAARRKLIAFEYAAGAGASQPTKPAVGEAGSLALVLLGGPATPASQP